MPCNCERAGDVDVVCIRPFPDVEINACHTSAAWRERHGRKHWREVTPSENRLRRLTQHVVSPEIPTPSLPAPVTAAAPDSDARGPLTGSQISFFNAFGFLHLKHTYNEAEIQQITEAAEDWRWRSADTRKQQPAETEPLLTMFLLEDQRVHGSITQLMHSMGEPTFLLAHSGYGGVGYGGYGGGRNLKSTMWKGHGTLPKGSPPAEDEDWTEHGIYTTAGHACKALVFRHSNATNNCCLLLAALLAAWGNFVVFNNRLAC
eukprot:SAG11_NODE_1454_length_4879_cov_4.858577_3_plen_261_part_00